MKTEKSRAPARSWVKKALCGGAFLGLALGIQSVSASEYGHSKSISFSPFSRIATMLAVQDENGNFDKVATELKAKEAAQALGHYLVTTDETGDPNFPGNDWILGGVEGTPETEEEIADAVKHAILGIPTPTPIKQKVNVLDLCNKTYASMALGVNPIIGGDTLSDPTDDKFVVNGYSHTTTLPCEVAIHYDENNIYVDMLDPSAIFKLFFSDVIFSDEMKDDAFAAAIEAMPPQVKKELKAIIYTALEAFDANLVQMDERMGPAYESIGDIIRTVQKSPQQSPYKHVAYKKKYGGVFTPDESKLAAQTIINTMTIHGETHPDGLKKFPAAGFHVDGLESILSDDSKWRSARPTPLGLPGKPGKNWVIEACSPTYANLALSTGVHHATALPCEISVQIIDNDEHPGAETLVVSYLDAHFMFGALFSDMSKEEMEDFADVPTDVMDDLEAIVKYSLENDFVDGEGDPIALNPPTQIKYSMLPGKKVGKFK